MSQLAEGRAPVARQLAARPLRWQGLARRVLAHLVLLAGSLTMVLPFLWMVSTAVKGDQALLAYPPQFIPDPVLWRTFVEVFQVQPFALYLGNSFLYAVLATLGQLATCSMAAYAFARLRFAGRDVLFTLLVASLMIPYQVTMIPVFIVMKYLGWIDSFAPLIVPNWAGGAFGTFLLRQFFLTIPSELMDAAKIDGSNYYGILWRIYLPLAGPALATLGVFTFMWAWNDLLGPLIYLNSPDHYTVSIGLAFFQSRRYTIWGQMMAGAVISLLPIVVLFLVAQKYFVQGIATTGLRR
jgi:ABC-type glycerol-3-phosphate transport system permease component